MNPPSPMPLALSLTLARTLLDQAAPGYAGALAVGLSGDPYFVDLPAFHGGLGGQVTPDALRVIASLYFTAEIESTYLMAVGEELARARFTLNLTDREAAAKLEALATQIRHEWVDRDLRNQIFARVFGIGYTDPNLGDGIVNQQFEPQFARVALALRDVLRGHPAYSSHMGAAMRLSVAANGLMNALAQKMQGNTLIVAERLTLQLQMTIDALNHPGLTALFMGRTAWDVVRGVLGEDTPDMLAQVNRAQTGMRIMAWMAAHLDALRSGDGPRILAAAEAEPQVGALAELWLHSAGAEAAGPAQTQPGPYQQSYPYQQTHPDLQAAPHRSQSSCPSPGTTPPPGPGPGGQPQHGGWAS